MANAIIALAGGIIISYLLGSISFAVVFSWAFSHKDVRNYGSGNAGMTNVLRSVGVLPGVLTFVCDFLKGVVAVLIGRYLVFAFAQPFGVIIPEYAAFFCGMACQLGHIFPVFYGFRGGKSVSTSVAVLFAVDWRAGFIALGTFVLMVLITKIVSISSIVGALTAPFSLWFLLPKNSTLLWQVLLCSWIVAVLVIAHWQNIGRLIRGEEKKLTIKLSRRKGDK
ncbi:MAG: glycerol-3-phosphate 1-O-acyltransferase PlsY [Clostridia bacterium]|nr:glycerol-3-phosphate 1-O-acyltransferase PlsY [Clostridia bacterium]